MNKDQLLAVKAQIDADYKADSTAIEQLLSRFGEERSHRQTKVAELVAMARPKKSTSQVTEEIIRNRKEAFEVSDIFLELEKVLGPSTNYSLRLRIISQVIHKFTQRQPAEIATLEKGRGRRSGRYQWVGIQR